MDSDAHVPPASETTPFWTDEKHVHFLNTMEASFVRTMFESKGASTRLDRYLPDTSESTLDLKSHPRRRIRKHHAPAVDSMGPTTRRTRRRSSQHYNSSQDQVYIICVFAFVLVCEDERSMRVSSRWIMIQRTETAFLS
ncbi:transmembrane ascorbate ferrireductase [Spatholobus suberectus]|nr:transmembrane ascorbate ferrireductase [Spatholobus suberectus]